MLPNESFGPASPAGERAELERLIASFEQGWRRGERPDIERFLPTTGPRGAVLVELAHADLEFRLRAGEPARVEEYLRRFPELGARESVVVGLIAAEFRWRRDREPGLDREEYARRFDREQAAALEDPEDGSGRPSGSGDAADAACPPPRVVGRYELLEIVGRGAVGVVYRARDVELGRIVAVKVPRPDRIASRAAADRMLREARIAAGLRHPNIVPIYDAGRDGETLYLVSAFVRGVTPARRSAGGRLNFREAARLVAEAAEALHYAHGLGVIHRDLKPSNLLVDADGRAHVLDFGLARSSSADGGETLTVDGQILGTPAYMAPELARGEARRVDARCDVYGLGVVLYELLTGERPFRGQGRMVLIQVLEDEPRPPRRLDDGVPRDLETICLKAMAKEPAWRYPTAQAMADDLGRFLRGEPVQARPLGAMGRLWRRCRRKPATAVMAASLILSVAVGLAGISWQWRRAEAQALANERQRARAWAAFNRAHAAVLAFTRLGQDRALRSPEGEQARGELLRTALDYYRDVVRACRDDPSLLAEMATACQEVAEVQRIAEAPPEDSLRAAGQAVEVWESLARDHPDRLEFRSHLAEAHRRRAVLLLLIHRPDEALHAYAQAGALCRALIHDDPSEPAYRADLARVEVDLGVLHKKSGRREEALAAFRRARALYEGMDREAAVSPEHREALASCLYYIAEILRPAVPTKEVADALARCRELMDGLLRERPTHFDFLVIQAKAVFQTGGLLRDQGRASEALDAYRSAESRFAQLVATIPNAPNFRRDRGASRHSQGSLLAELGRIDEAIAAYRSAIADREELRRLQPDAPDVRRDLAGSWRNLGEVLEIQGRREEAVAAFQAADELSPRPVQHASVVSKDSRDS
jgi:tetratricopeptide (TPR) repeat protein/tRNA A-37 threonylcarbamoyl transferase component Bud32